MTSNGRNYSGVTTAASVAIVAALVAVGWFISEPRLVQVSPFFATMKPASCVGFFLCGLAYAMMFFDRGHRFAKVWLPILFIGAAMPLGSLLGFLFPPDVDLMVVSPGIPSIGSVVLFLLLGMIGLCWALGWDGACSLIAGFGASVAAVAVAGYIVNFPALYFYVPGVSSAMAIHTGVLFFVLFASVLVQRNPGGRDRVLFETKQITLVL